MIVNNKRVDEKYGDQIVVSNENFSPVVFDKTGTGFDN